MFDTVVEHYVRGRPDMPLEAVQDAARQLGLRDGARVLEIGGGTGQLTTTLVAAGFEVVALEPGAAFRERLASRVPEAEIVASTFEDYEAPSRFAAVFASNAFHWVDPAVGYAKVARDAEALVLLWDMPFPADAAVFRRVQDEVMSPRGSTFPNNARDARAMFERDAAAGREELAESNFFEEPSWRIYDRELQYTPDRYVSLILSMSNVAARPDGVRRELADALLGVLPEGGFPVSDPVYAVAAKVRA